MGAKRKNGERYASGRRKVIRTMDALNELNARKQREVKATALAQPHRRGKDDPRLSDALGRFCARHKLGDELYEAGCDYERAMARWRAACSAPRVAAMRRDMLSEAQQEGATVAAYIAAEDDGEAERRLRERIHGAKAAMVRESFNGYLSIHGAAIDGNEIDDTWAEHAKLSLKALAVFFGRLDKKALQMA